MASSDSGKYNYNLEKLSFRNEAAIRIPKSGDEFTLNLETCYKLAVDIIIESVTQEEYLRYSTIPAHGFWGYATLVMRDCISPKIKLEFGRNRIFEQRVTEAFQTWQELAFYLQTTVKFLRAIFPLYSGDNQPNSLTTLCDIPSYSSSFSEIDLREIYVKVPDNSQFRIELSWISPKKFTDDCGKDQDGKSKEPADPDKDKGLPKDGTQPKKNPASNPWGGNKPFSPPSSTSPYFNDKLSSNLNKPDKDNDDIPDIPDNWGYFAEVRTQYWQQCVKYQAIAYWLINSGDSVSIPFQDAFASECGELVYYFDLVGSVSGLIASGFPSIQKNASVSVIRSPSLPPNQAFPI